MPDPAVSRSVIAGAPIAVAFAAAALAAARRSARVPGHRSTTGRLLGALARSACAASLALLIVAPGTSLAAAPPPDEGGGGREVHRLKRWNSAYIYRVTRTFRARREPARAADRVGTSVAKGFYFAITCQAYAITARGRELWTGMAGGYVPDSIVKTYTDRRLRRVPRCRFARTGHVFGAKRWRKRNRYRVQVSQVTQRRPRLGNGTGVIVRKDDWVRIVCQIRGRRVHGSRLWDRVSPGGYLPDADVRTYYSGRIPGAPRCRRPKPPVTPVYMALGDSYSSGLGSDVYYSAPADSYAYQPGQYFSGNPVGGPSDKDCYRGVAAWPRLLAGRTRRRYHIEPHTTFLACQGDTTREILRRQIPHIRRQTRLVTLTAMGNDMGFSEIVKACATPLQSCGDAVRKHFGRRNRVLRRKIRRLDRVLRRIRAKAPRARVLLLGYPKLFGPVHSNFNSCLRITDDDQRLLNRKARALNGAIRRAARRHRRVSYIGLSRAFRGHGPCRDASATAWVNPILYQPPNSVPDPPNLRSMHPNRIGNFMIAERVARTKPDLFR
jgi:hypothetical protein